MSTEIEFSWPFFKFVELAGPRTRLSLDEQTTMRAWRKIYLNDDRRRKLWRSLYDGEKIPRFRVLMHYVRIAFKYTWPSLGLAIMAGKAGVGAALFLAIPLLPIQGWLGFLFVVRTWEALVIVAAVDLEKRV